MKQPIRKADANQAEIVSALRKAGCSVQPIHMVGRGCPDLLVGRAQKNYVLEVKRGTRPCDRKLTEDENIWFLEWRGQADVVSTVREALKAVGIEVAG